MVLALTSKLLSKVCNTFLRYAEFRCSCSDYTRQEWSAVTPFMHTSNLVEICATFQEILTCILFNKVVAATNFDFQNTVAYCYVRIFSLLLRCS